MECMKGVLIALVEAVWGCGGGGGGAAQKSAGGWISVCVTTRY